MKLLGISGKQELARRLHGLSQTIKYTSKIVLTLSGHAFEICSVPAITPTIATLTLLKTSAKNLLIFRYILWRYIAA